jgi:phosphoribosylanthranilate isomerase
MLVQIYEVQTPEEAVALARLGVDHVGVLVGDGVFPRELPVEQATAIFTATPPGTKRVALSLSAELAEVARVARETQPDIIQIQAAPEDFSVANMRALKAQFPEILVMRAIPIIDETSIEIARSYQGVADFLLLDSYDPGSRQFGALGRTHDWSLSRRIVDRVSIPAILAGGLGPNNVAEAIAAVRPAGVDSKTKTDRPDGAGKDLDKVRRFIAAAKITK